MKWNNENNTYKICKKCKKSKLNDQFYRNTNGTLSTYCMECNSDRVAEWNKKNHKQKMLKNYKYISIKENLIQDAIKKRYRYSNVDKQQNLLAGNKEWRKIYIPTLTQEEFYNEYLIHVQNMKQKFPESNGDICRYCEKPYTFLRSKPQFDEKGKKIKKKRNHFPTNFSIDRFYNEKTYCKGNIIFCCKQCNNYKNASTKKMWLKLLEIDKELQNEME